MSSLGVPFVLGRRNLLIGIAAVLGGVLVYVLVDLLVVTEEERLEQFTDDVTGELTEARIDAALERYVDLAALPLEVHFQGEEHAFGEGDEARLREWVLDGAGPFLGDDLRRIERIIEIDGGSARVIVRAVSPFGVSEFTYELRRLEEGWRVQRARAQPRAGTHLFGR